MATALHHVVVEGPIGVGKTSLARRLAVHFGAELLLEQPEANPFLERFYRDIARYALQTQLAFLFQRVQQMRELAQLDLFARHMISDFLLGKDALFARLTLGDDELKLYADRPQRNRPKEQRAAPAGRGAGQGLRVRPHCRSGTAASTARSKSP